MSPMTTTSPSGPAAPAPMPRRTLGPSGPAVGAVGLGCMGMSWAYGAAERDDAQSREVLRRAHDMVTALTAEPSAPG